MTYRDILLHLTDDARNTERTAAALRLARLHNAHLIALYTLPPPVMPYYVGEYVPTEFIQQQITEAKKAAAKAKAAFDAACSREGIVAEWIESERLPADAAAIYSRAVDLVVLGQPDPGPAEPHMAASGLAVFPHELALNAGRPILVIPYAGTFPKIGERVMVAWNGSRESTRAVHDAMPFLKRAKSVTVFGVDPEKGRGTPGADIARHLARHDVKVEVTHTVADSISAGDALLSTVADRGIDLLVMGAYGHSRLREMVFGGVTETILDSMTVPVLLSN